MNSDLALAIDAGTTTVRAMIVDAGGGVRGSGHADATMRFPAPMHAEQDAVEYWDAVQAAVSEALKSASAAPSDLAAVGIASQRSCCVVSDRATGDPLTPIVSWQDLRGAVRAQELRAAGFEVLPYAAACKLESLIDGIDGGRARAEAGELAWGNVDSYIAARMGEGRPVVTDPSQACTTGYYDFESGDWSDEMLDYQKLPRAMFPRISDTAGIVANTDAFVSGASVPIAAIVGDQQSAAFAQGVVEPGMVKITLGTSATADVCTGNDIVIAQGAYPLVQLRHNSQTTFCLEAMVVTAGAFIDWVARELVRADSGEDVDALAASVDSSSGVLALPALQGLGSPFADPTRCAEFRGLTRGSSRAQIARGAFEGIAYRIRSMLDAVYKESAFPRPDTIRVDGGLSQSSVLLQAIADATGCAVERMRPYEASAFGAAALAFVGVATIDITQAAQMRTVDVIFEPNCTDDERETRYSGWHKAFRLDEYGV